MQVQLGNLCSLGALIPITDKTYCTSLEQPSTSDWDDNLSYLRPCVGAPNERGMASGPTVALPNFVLVHFFPNLITKRFSVFFD